jgi:hypothetical protein
MAFELPPDSPVQQLQSTAEALASIVATYRAALIRGGIPEEFADALTEQYAQHMLNLIHRIPPPAPPAPNGTTERSPE